jgi:hypothetical protein
MQLATERIRNKELEDELDECRRELSESYRATVILKYGLLWKIYFDMKQSINFNFFCLFL